jgi:hypothetical protein
VDARQDEHEPGTGGSAAFDPQASSLSNHGGTCQGEAEPSPRCRFVESLEFAEDALTCLEWNTRAVVRHLKAKLSSRVDAPRDSYPRTHWRVHRNILEEISDCLIQQPSIELH